MNVFEKIVACEQQMTGYLDSIAQRTKIPHSYDWTNIVWSNGNFRRAHLDAVDAIESRGLYMLHLCVFPHDHNPSPIYGFDIICGKTKVTGAFHDYSKTGDDQHPMMDFFAHKVSQFDWIKPRELPDWGKAIFSPSIVAVGNINTESEMDTIIKLALSNLVHFCSTVGQYNNTAKVDQIPFQNRYCHYQKQNPHTPKVMAALGLDPDEVHRFIHEELFPEVQ